MISSKRDEISAALDFGSIGTADALDRSRFNSIQSETTIDRFQSNFAFSERVLVGCRESDNIGNASCAANGSIGDVRCFRDRQVVV
ncbi:hypothetical protein GCM10023156_51690 [Novipirellula rosea]|uniref:Uncharacterized protein n=1 Tax=Novipirellula rosea TaxID=1031540 RepID=A0ABP8NC21_9BACT